MIRTILYSILFLQSYSVYSQAKISKPLSINSNKTIIDFGAIPDDNKDDSWAFIKAGKYFSNKWDINGIPLPKGKVNFDYAKFSAKLVIPSGNYLVGKQVRTNAKDGPKTYGEVFNQANANASLIYSAEQAFVAGLELIELYNESNNIDQVIITGEGKTRPVIKYNDGIVLGYFNNKGVPQFVTDETYNGKFAVTIGNFLYTMGCKNIVLNNVEIDGNNTPTFNGGKTIYNGGYATHRIQMGGSAAYFINTKNVTVTNASFHHMTMDGLIFQDYYKDNSVHLNQPISNLFVNNVVCNYNRRQGFSWVGGRNINVSNSKFNNTGTTVTGVALGNPAAGLDIEPEMSSDGALLYCMDAKFINCEFVNNVGNAFLNDMAAHRSKNIKFEGCIFHDVDNYAVWTKGQAIQFDNCKIWGGFVYGNSGDVPENATVFNNCDFADEEVAGRKGIYNRDYALVESWGVAKGMRFNNCSFRTLHPQQRLFAIYTPSIKEADFIVFSNCNFTVGQQCKGENILYGVVFDKNTSFLSLNKKDAEVISLNGVVIKGSTSAKTRYTFTTKGRIQLFPANSNGLKATQFQIGRSGTSMTAMNGFVDFNIGDESCLFAHWSQTIDVGKNTRLFVKRGGQLAWLSGVLNNGGAIVLEDGSYSALFNPVNINTSNTGTPSFCYHKNAIIGLNDFWGNQLNGLRGGLPLRDMKLSSNTRFDGGNSEIPQKFRRGSQR